MKRELKKMRLFIWDFDGTLMDTYPPLVRVMLQAAERAGGSVTPEHALDLMKDNLRHAIKVVGEECGMTFEEFNVIFREEEKSITPEEIIALPGIPEMLEALHQRGARHFLLTHRDHLAWEYLEHGGLKHYFTGGIIQEDKFPRKPHPESLMYLMNRYGVSPEEAVMVGDRPLDTGAGRNAGVLSCLLDTEDRFPKEPAEIIVSDPRMLLSALAPEDLHL